MDKFEFIEHTADIGIRVNASTVNDLFINSAQSLFSLITDINPKPNKLREIKLSAGSLEELLVFWLNELLSVFYTYGFLPSGYHLEIKGNSSKSIKAKIKGTTVDLYSIDMKEEIKAVTYHNIKIEKNDKGYAVEMIFDV